MRNRYFLIYIDFPIVSKKISVILFSIKYCKSLTDLYPKICTPNFNGRYTETTYTDYYFLYIPDQPLILVRSIVCLGGILYLLFLSQLRLTMWFNKLKRGRLLPSDFQRLNLFLLFCLKDFRFRWDMTLVSTDPILHSPHRLFLLQNKEMCTVLFPFIVFLTFH